MLACEQKPMISVLNYHSHWEEFKRYSLNAFQLSPSHWLVPLTVDLHLIYMYRNCWLEVLHLEAHTDVGMNPFTGLHALSMSNTCSNKVGSHAHFRYYFSTIKNYQTDVQLVL